MAKVNRNVDACVFVYRSGVGLPILDKQMEEFHIYARQRNLKEVLSLDLSRPEQEIKDQLKKACESYGVKTLVCWRLDALALGTNSFQDFCELVADLEGAGIRFVSMKDNIDSRSSVEEFLLNGLRGWTNYRINRKIEVARTSAVKAKERGSHLGKLKIRNDDVIRDLRKKGLSIREIAFRTGVSTSAVQRALRNTAVAVTVKDLST